MLQLSRLRLLLGMQCLLMTLTRSVIVLLTCPLSTSCSDVFSRGPHEKVLHLNSTESSKQEWFHHIEFEGVVKLSATLTLGWPDDQQAVINTSSCIHDGKWWLAGNKRHPVLGKIPGSSGQKLRSLRAH